MTRERTLSVNVPAGVEDGTRIRLTGEGEAGTRGGPTGDLYIFLSVKPHPVFQRDGADLYCRVPISMVQAALGGEFTVHTLDGAEFAGQHPRGRAIGPAAEAARQGHADPPLARRRRSLRATQCRDAAEFDAPPARTPDGIRAGILAQDPPESAGFFAKMKEFFEGRG